MTQLARVYGGLYVGNYQACGSPRWAVAVHLHDCEPNSICCTTRHRRNDFHLWQVCNCGPLSVETQAGLATAWRMAQHRGVDLLIHCAAVCRRIYSMGVAGVMRASWRVIPATARLKSCQQLRSRFQLPA